MERVFSINVVIDDVYEVNGTAGSATMITFHGNSDCDNFKGNILPGGVDTQKQSEDGVRSLSARYILEGKDVNGEECRIFIENNGAFQKDGSIVTKPLIYTDSKALKWMESADLKGTITGTENGVLIEFFK